MEQSYSDYWNIPGGCVDENESLLGALQREVMEEIGIGLEVDRLLVIDCKNTLLNEEYKDESVQFIFLAKTMTDDKIKKIKIDNDEIIDFNFVEIEEAKKVLNPKIVKRLDALDGNYIDLVFLENMERVF